MNQRKQTFIELALAADALKFGQFTLKSGRISPYFFNAGLFHQGSSIQKLGQLYAETLVESGIAFDTLFGPAYKGIPLATATAVALANMGLDVGLCFNRKEAKTHGEGGSLIGAPLQGRTVIIDDVITAGTAFRESEAIIHAEGAEISAVIIALNRCERGLGNKSALQDIEDRGIKVLSIIELADLISYLQAAGKRSELAALEAYQQEYGI